MPERTISTTFTLTAPGPLFFVHTAFWCHLRSITEQTHDNLESICELELTKLHKQHPFDKQESLQVYFDTVATRTWHPYSDLHKFCYSYRSHKISLNFSEIIISVILVHPNYYLNL